MENTTNHSNSSSNQDGGNGSKPFSLRLTFEERAYLEEQATGMPLSAYVRVRLFGENAPKRKTRGKYPVKDYHALAQILACLGASRLANNINQLTKAMNSGSIIFSDMAEFTIEEAGRDIEAMKLLLMQALGMQVGKQDKESLSQTFTRAAAKPDPFDNPKLAPKSKNRQRL